MNEINKDRQLLQIAQGIETLRIEANHMLNEFGIQHHKVLNIYRSLNRAAMFYQKRRMAIFNAWLQEATKKHPDAIPAKQEDLLLYICELRRRLVIITNIYGRESQKSLIYSQYLDRFIVKYQRNEQQQLIAANKKIII